MSLIDDAGHCWACAFDWTRAGYTGSRVRRDTAAALYELAVETIEAQPGPFSLTSVWMQVRPLADSVCGGHRSGYRWGPTSYGYVRLAVRDMARHGLIRCARTDAVGRRCLAWELTGPVSL